MTAPADAAPTLPRILAIMGSGETAPTMARVHRDLLARLAPTAPAVVIDTTYGFQENADDITGRIVEYFRDSVGRPGFDVASYRSRDVDGVDAATAVARIRDAAYVLAGPGSPSYALRQWTGGPIPGALAAKLASGGIVTMASAAALTLGVATVPVYEIYKVGEEPHWLPGLDLLGPVTGLRAAVVPHYDNAEGGNHDTRFCYVGERRLRRMEAELPAEAFILGVDSHTALVLDLDAQTATVAGLGGVTVRVAGRSAVIPTGSRVPIARIADLADFLRTGTAATGPTGAPAPGDATPADRAAAIAGTGAGAGTRDAADVADAEGRFTAALDAGEVRAALAILLDLDLALEARLRRGEDSPDLDAGRAVYRAMVVRLADAAGGVRDRRDVVDPFVETILELRSRARAARDWAAADLIRERLAAAGVEVRDGASGSEWVLDEESEPAEPGARR